MNAAEAISAVAEHVRTAGLNYPTEGLVADRIGAGWSVYALRNIDPDDRTNVDVTSSGHATFLVSDTEGVKQVSSTSLQESQQRAAERDHALAGASSLSTDAQFMTNFGRSFETAASPVAAGLDVISDPADRDDDGVDDDQRAARASAMLDPIAHQLASLGPDEWLWYRAEFALTVSAGIANVSFETSDGWQLQLADVPEDIMTLVREQREASAEMPAGPWWRLVLDVSSEGELVVGYDYGDDPFPEDQLQPAQNYRDDIAAYPRPSLPVWLVAYLAGPTAQGRDPRTAESAVSADVVTGRVATPTDDIAPLRDIWAGWAVLAALDIGVRSESGPRLAPGLAWYESDDRSGSTLVLLTGDRAVLSGGWWDSPLLSAAYLEDQPLPDLFAGAPGWVSDAVLNIRSRHGLLSFCYWWVDGRWWRGATETIDELGPSLPAVWSAEATLAAMTQIVQPADETAFHALLAAATDGAITVAQLDAVLGAIPDSDSDAALNQLAAAGLIR